MPEPDARAAPAAAAAIATVSALGLPADEAIVLRASNRFALRLLPCDVVARVAPPGHDAAPLEVALASQLARDGVPVAALDPRVEPRVYERDGFAITLWTHYATQPSRELRPDVYADALRRLHAAMRTVDLPTPHVVDRITEAELIIASTAPSEEASAADLALVASTLSGPRRAMVEGGAAAQLLHGEPMPGNVLNTSDGPLFIDLETCCRGPVEFDLAHVPAEVADAYPELDRQLLEQCRGLVLAMVAAWRLDPADRLPGRAQALRELIAAVRAGPPYPTLAEIAGPDTTA